MFKVYFGDLSDGRLKGLAFLGYWLLLIAIFFGFGFLAVVAIGLGEHVIGGDLAKAQDALRKALGVPFLIVFGLFFLGLVFANLNIMAKRARDIGLPGWITAIVAAGLSGLGGQAMHGVGGGLGLLIILALVLIPTDFARRT